MSNFIVRTSSSVFIIRAASNSEARKIGALESGETVNSCRKTNKPVLLALTSKG